MIKKIILAVLVIAVLVGGFYFIRFQRTLYNAIKITQFGLADTVNFLKVKFPAEVAEYNASQNKGSQPAVAPAPENK